MLLRMYAQIATTNTKHMMRHKFSELPVFEGKTSPTLRWEYGRYKSYILEAEHFLEHEKLQSS